MQVPHAQLKMLSPSRRRSGLLPFVRAPEYGLRHFDQIGQLFKVNLVVGKRRIQLVGRQSWARCRAHMYTIGCA